MSTASSWTLPPELYPVKILLIRSRTDVDPSASLTWPILGGKAGVKEAPLTSPGIAAFFQLRNSVIRYCKPLLFGQTFFQSANDLSGAPQCEGNRVPKHFTPREHVENGTASPYILYG